MEKETEFVKGKDLIKRIKSLIKSGQVNKIVVKNRQSGEVLVKIPVNYALVSFVLIPFITILTGLVAMIIDFELEIEKKE